MYGPAVSSPLSKSAPVAIDRKPGRASMVRPTISRYPADRKNRAVIAIGNVRGEMAECHLLGGGPIVELVGRHFFDGTDCVLGATGKHLAQYVGDGVLGFLGESCAGEKQDQCDEFHAGLRNFASRIILEGGTCRLERHLLHFFDSRSTLA